MSQNPTPELLAEEFVLQLKQTLSPFEWQRMRQRNATSEYAGDACASHDYCDANMVMFYAFQKLYGREMALDDSPQADEDLKLSNAAWAIAKAKDLTEQPPAAQATVNGQ